MGSSKIKSLMNLLADKARTTKDKVQLKIMINKAVEDGELSDEEKAQISEAIANLGLDEATTMEGVNEKLAKVQFRLNHLAAIDEKVEGLVLVDGQVDKSDFDELVAIADEIDKKESFIETKLFEKHGPQCLKAIRRPDLEEKISKASANGKISEIEHISIKKFATKYGFDDAEVYTLIGEKLKNS